MPHNEIEPALSREQWAERHVTGLSSHDDLRVWLQVEPDGAIKSHNDNGEEYHDVRIAPEKAPAVIALLNSILPADDPRKITRAGLRAVESAIAFAVSEGAWQDWLPELEAHAAAIDALLPPDEVERDSYGSVPIDGTVEE